MGGVVFIMYVTASFAAFFWFRGSGFVVLREEEERGWGAHPLMGWGRLERREGKEREGGKTKRRGEKKKRRREERR